MDPNYLIVRPVEFGGAPRPRLLLKDVYKTYAAEFRRWFAITAPTSLLASAVLLMADRKIHQIFRSFPTTQISFHMLGVAEAGALRYGSFFISWFLGCFALAAIATVINGLNKVERDDVWISDSFQRARENFGPLLMTAILTFGMFLAGMAVAGFILFAVARAVGWARFSRFGYWASSVSVVFVGSVVGWFGMAIPLILAEGMGVWSALKRSIKTSDGYEIFIFLLICESIVGSYVAWYAVSYGLALLFPAQLRYTQWYGWVVYFVTILASAAVQPPMFIGFSLLASARNPDLELLSNSQQPAQVR
jgi:hypothetical protein